MSRMPKEVSGRWTPTGMTTAGTSEPIRFRTRTSGALATASSLADSQCLNSRPLGPFEPLPLCRHWNRGSFEFDTLHSEDVMAHWLRLARNSSGICGRELRKVRQTQEHQHHVQKKIENRYI